MTQDLLPDPGDALLGIVTETAPASDTASSGLNGRLQRIAQRLTSLIALLPAALGAGGGMKVDGSGTALPVSGTVDTELPAAAALSDALGNPTAPAVGAYGLLWNGTAWARAASLPGANVGVAKSALYGWDGSSAGAVYTGFDSLDGVLTGKTPLLVEAEGALFNGAEWDRARANFATSYLASAARTTTPAVSDITTYNARGIRVFIDVTAITATPSVVFTIEAKGSVSGLYSTLLTSAAIVGTGQTTLVVMPGVDAAANVTAAVALARTLRILPTHGDADSITYSVSYDLLV